MARRPSLRNWVKSPARYFVIPVLAVTLATGLEQAFTVHSSSADAADWGTPGFGPRTFAEAMAHTADQIDLGRERIRNGPDQWLREESLARALMARSRLSYSYDELSEANTILASAISQAPSHSGPLMSEAVLAMMSHQLDDSQTALDGIAKWAVPADSGQRAECEGLRGDIAFFRGDMQQARAHYRAASKLESSDRVAYRLARYAKASGDYDLAIDKFEQADPPASKATPFVNANTAMQIGAVELARGNYEHAQTWFEAADREFPGYWLFEAHLAQSKALAGDLDGAIASMRAVARKSPSAEVMDALAMLLRTNGEAAESRAWAARAGQVWQRRLVQLPKAAYAHALEHELVFGSPQRALSLAELNLRSRPYAESRIFLASALLENGRPQDALAQLDVAEASGWRSAPMYAMRVRTLEFLGRDVEAKEARSSAKTLNPRIFDPVTSLVWLSHG